MERRTVSELRWIVFYFMLAISSAVFQSFILPMAHLAVFWNFVMSVGVSEAINTVVDLGIGRHVRAFGAALAIHIDSHVFTWVEKQSEPGLKRQRLALVKEALRKSEGPGNFLFAVIKAVMVWVSVFLGVCHAVWTLLGMWSIPCSAVVAVGFEIGLAATQWRLTWSNAKRLNDARSSLNQNMLVARHSPSLLALVGATKWTNL